MNTSLQSLKTTLLNIDHVHLNSKWNYDNVISPFSRLYLIKSGHAIVHHHERIFHLKPGYLYLIPSFTYSRYKCTKYIEQVYAHFLEEVGSGLSIYNIKTFQYEVKANALAKQLFNRLLQLNPNRSLLQDNPKVYDNISSLKSFDEKNNSQASSDYLETNGILQILLSQFIEEKNVIYHPASNKVTEILHYISEHLSETLTVDSLAKRCHINTDYFSRLFKQQTGVRPVKYIQQKRIERAKILLATTNHSMQTIADMIGLPNISYFSRLFLKHTDKAPGAYKKEYWSI
jgi:YesN/AraC family two-component response regulator